MEMDERFHHQAPGQVVNPHPSGPIINTAKDNKDFNNNGSNNSTQYKVTGSGAIVQKGNGTWYTAAGAGTVASGAHMTQSQMRDAAQEANRNKQGYTPSPTYKTSTPSTQGYMPSPTYKTVVSANSPNAGHPAAPLTGDGGGASRQLTPFAIQAGSPELSKASAIPAPTPMPPTNAMPALPSDPTAPRATYPEKNGPFPVPHPLPPTIRPITHSGGPMPYAGDPIKPLPTPGFPPNPMPMPKEIHPPSIKPITAPPHDFGDPIRPRPTPVFPPPRQVTPPKIVPHIGGGPLPPHPIEPVIKPPVHQVALEPKTTPHLTSGPVNFGAQAWAGGAPHPVAAAFDSNVANHAIQHGVQQAAHSVNPFAGAGHGGV